MRFEFATANRILFGPGVLSQVGEIAEGFGKKALVVSGRSTPARDLLLEKLAEKHVAASVYPVQGEPSLETAEGGIGLARETGCDLVIGFGGGSAVDTAKAITAMLANPGDLLDYLEVIGRGKVLANAPLPCMAIPTTAGTGSEVTRNAVLASPEKRVKVSLRSPLMLPKVALVDPELTYSMPPKVTASTGMDALTQVIEPFLSTRANPLVDALCRDGIRRAARSLLRATRDGEDKAAREEMSLASLYGGLALANAGLGAVHGFAGPIGGMFPAPHGAVCARLLPPVMEMNALAVRARDPQGSISQRMQEVAALLTGNENAEIREGVAWLEDLCNALEIPALSAYGLTRQDVPTLVEKAAASSSMKANPVKLTPDELAQILEKAL